MAKPPDNIHDPEFVADLFDRCAANYRWASAISSFGFIKRWRRQCIELVPAATTPGSIVYGFMAGTGEIWPYALKHIGKDCKIVSIDISKEMHKHAVEKLHRHRAEHIEYRQANILDVDLAMSSADYVVSTFGLKTMNQQQQTRIAAVVADSLKPGGHFTLLEASDPVGWVLRPLYRFYLAGVLPLVEKTIVRGARDFSMIGDYTREFGNVSYFADELKKQGLEVKTHRFMFGCATAVSGFKTANIQSHPGADATV